jgi:Mg2+ and Co2+ transporter CorA
MAVPWPPYLQHGSHPTFFQQPAKSSTRRGAFFWRNPHGTWKSSISSEGLPSLQRLVESYGRTGDQLEERLAKRPGVDILHEVLQVATPLSRTTRNLQAALQEAREAVDDPDIINLRDSAGDAHRTFETVRQDARHTLQFLLALQAERQSIQAANLARAGYRLHLLAAVFLPITAIAAIFGMNLSSGLESVAPPFPFWALSAGLVFSGWLLLRWSDRSE